MKWFLIAAGIFLLLILAMLILGWLQPVKHSVKRSAHLRAKPEAVFAVIDDVDGTAAWSSAVLKTERLPDREGRPTARVTLKWGHMQMIMTQLERTPPNRLVVQMTKEGGPVMGTWTYELSPADEGCRIEITEEGELKNPFYRAIGRLRGLDANIQQTLADLAAKFAEHPPKR